MRVATLKLLIAVLALAAMGCAIWQLQQLRQGLAITTDRIASDRDGFIPVTIWRDAAAPMPAPVVVIAHGFAGSQQLMQTFAITLARNGYVAVTFDFPGHGRNPTPLSGGLADVDAMQRDLLGSLDRVAQYALNLPGADGRLAIVGHSMAADVVVRYASSHQAVAATAAVSLFLPNPAQVHPRNLLIVDGAWEASMLRDQAFTIVGASIPGELHDGVTYGNLADGSARRIAYARGVEHIGVLYSADAMHETLTWFNQVFERNSNGFLALSGKWLGLLLLGVVALAWPLSQCLPRLASAAPAQALGWPALLALAVAPALLTPLILWRLPTQFLPILLGDYLTLHFGLYGVLTAVGLWVCRRRLGGSIFSVRSPSALLLPIALVAAYSLLTIGLALDSYVFSFVPGSWRVTLIAVVFCGTLPYFLADEWLTRTAAPQRGAYAFTKLCFLISLVIAIALNLEKLFFLVIIVPAILLLFLIYGIFSAWVYRRTRNPWVAAVANAIVFAWFIAVTFPIVSR